MAQIFVSHSSEDNATAADIMTWLRTNGFDQTFLDIDKQSGIQPGMNWERTLYQQIDSSQAVILILTPSWLDSKWCFAEFTQARALGKAIFPVIVAPGAERFVAPDIQHLDLLKDREGGLDRLRRELTQLALDSQGGFPWDPRRPPYPGLLAFEADDAAIFFGRDDEVRRLIERLSARRVQGSPNVVALLGASGSGKSSLMRAGVLPRLRRDKRNWIVLPPFRPRLDPIGEFARAVCEALGEAEDWRKWRNRLASDGAATALTEFTEGVQTAPGSREAYVLIAVDQFEELFTVTPKEDRERFLSLLRVVGDDRTMFVTLLCMRSDFLGMLQKAAEGVVRFDEFSLGPMHLSRLRQVIEGPARVAGLKVDEDLITAATKDAGTEDSLPLLAFTLRELYDRNVSEREGDGQQLSLAQYTALGDSGSGLNPLENSVRRRADEVLADAQLSGEEMIALREAFVGGMVRIDDEGEYSRRLAFVEELPEKALPVLERLAMARLVIFADELGHRTVEAAHEALLRKWPRLRAWLDEERDFLIGRAQLDRALFDFQQASDDDKTAALLQGLLLSRARQWLVDHPRSLSAAATAFIKMSVAHAEAEERHRRMVRWGLIVAGVGAFSVVLIASGLIWIQQQNVEAAQREKEAAELGAEATQLAFEARDYRQTNNLRYAAAAAVEAVKKLSTEKTQSTLFETVMTISPNLVRSTGSDALRPSLLSYVPESAEVMIGSLSGRLDVWKSDVGGQLQGFAAFAPSQGTGPRPPAPKALIATEVGGAVVALADGRLIRLDATGRSSEEAMIAPDIDKAALAADGRRLVIASQSDRQIRDVACRGNADEECAKVVLADDYATALAIDTQARRAALALQTKGLVLVDLAEPSDLRPLALTGNPQIRSLAFDESGERLAVSTNDGKIYVASAEGEVVALAKQDTSATALAWSPSAPRLAAECDNFAVCIWDLASEHDPMLAARLVGHNNTVSAIAWSSDGGTIASTDINGEAKLWTVVLPSRLFFTLDAPKSDSLTDLALSVDGRWLAAGTSAGGVKVWDLNDGTFSKALSLGSNIEDVEGRPEVRSVQWHPTKPWIAAANKDGRVVVWDWPDGDVIDENDVSEGIIESIKWLPDGKSLVAGTLGGAIRLWPLGGQTLSFNSAHPEPVLGLALLPGSDRLLSSDAEGNLWQWGLNTRDKEPMDWASADNAVDILVPSHDGTHILAAGVDGTVYLYSLEEPGQPERINLGNARVSGAAWSQDDQLIAAVDTEGYLKVWSVSEAEMYISARIRSPEPANSKSGVGPFGHLHRMVWLSSRPAVAIATSSGKIVIAELDPPAWLDRVRSVFPAERSEDGDRP